MNSINRDSIELLTNKKCYGYNTVKELNYLITETQILDTFEKGFNNLIKLQCTKLNKSCGKVWYTRSYSKNEDESQDEFLIYFDVNEQEKLSKVYDYISSPIIEGLWLEKKFYIRNKIPDKFPNYVNEKYIPYIKELLISIYNFEESDEQLHHY